MQFATDYEATLALILSNGQDRGDRTGTGTRSMFGVRMEFDLKDSFPLITSKKVFWKAVVEELLWFLRGETNVKSLQDKGVTIWDEWAGPDGSLGPIYGAQWRSWIGERRYVHKNGSVVEQSKAIDQLQDVINQIKGNPESRRLLVSAWNPSAIPDMALPPCHVMFQFYVTPDGYLETQLYQRSGDMFLGVPFNIASYALLTYIVAHLTGLKPGRLIHVIGDAHIYHNHFDQVRTQLSRDVRPLPTLHVSASQPLSAFSLESFEFDDFVLEGYKPHPAIKGAVAV